MTVCVSVRTCQVYCVNCDVKSITMVNMESLGIIVEESVEDQNISGAGTE